MGGQNEEVAVFKPRRQTSEETKPAETLVLDCEKINFCCLSHPIHDILLWQSKQAKIPAGHQTLWNREQPFLPCPTVPRLHKHNKQLFYVTNLQEWFRNY